MIPRALTTVALALVGAASAPQAPMFRSSVDTVLVDVSVTRAGQPVTGLTAPDFRVTDNGVSQALADVSQETLPIDLTVVADLSATADGAPLDALRRSIDEILGRLQPADRASLIVFDQRMREVDLRARRLSITVDSTWSASSPAALFDAAAAALITPIEASRRRMVILFTEGQDQGSFLDEVDVADVASRGGATVFVVAVTDGTARVPRHPANLGLLARLTDLTGGLLAVVQRDEDLSASFVRAFEDFRTSYVLRYTPTGVPAAGWHALAVTLVGRSGLDVRARQGYVR